MKNKILQEQNGSMMSSYWVKVTKRERKDGNLMMLILLSPALE